MTRTLAAVVLFLADSHSAAASPSSGGCGSSNYGYGIDGRVTTVAGIAGEAGSDARHLTRRRASTSMPRATSTSPIPAITSFAS